MSTSKKITAKQYSNIIGLSRRCSLYIDRVLSNEQPKNEKEWNKRFEQLKLIDKKQ